MKSATLCHITYDGKPLCYYDYPASPFYQMACEYKSMYAARKVTSNLKEATGGKMECNRHYLVKIVKGPCTNYGG